MNLPDLICLAEDKIRYRIIFGLLSISKPEDQPFLFYPIPAIDRDFYFIFVMKTEELLLILFIFILCY